MRHLCESCGRDEELTPDAAFHAGWDHPPRMGSYGLIGPRLCPSCPITSSAWWALAMEGYTVDMLSDTQRGTVARIQAELPSSEDRINLAADLAAKAALVLENGWDTYPSAWDEVDVLGVRAVLNEAGAVDAAAEVWSDVLGWEDDVPATADHLDLTRAWFAVIRAEHLDQQ